VAWLILLLLAAGFVLGQTALLVEDEPLALEYGAYLQVGGKTYKAVAVYVPTFADAMFLPANATVRVPLYGGKILFVPVEEAKAPSAVGYIATDKGRIIFADEPPAIAFADTDNYTAITKHPAQKAKVVEKRLPPPRGLAPRPTPNNKTDMPKTGVGEEGPTGASINAQVEPLQVSTGSTVEAVGAIYTLGQINGGQYARPYKVGPVDPPCESLGNDVYTIYLGYGVRHAAIGVAPIQSGQGTLRITIYGIEYKNYGHKHECVNLTSLNLGYDSSWGRYFAYFIVEGVVNGMNVSERALAVAVQYRGTGAVSLNISVAYQRQVLREYQISTYQLEQKQFSASSSNHFSAVMFASLIPPDGVTDARLVVNGYLWADDAYWYRCNYDRLNFDVYINGIYEGRGTAYCYAVSSSTCRCDFNYAYTYSSAPFSLRYAKGFGRGVVLVALEFKRPDGGAPRIGYFQGGIEVSGHFWREIYRSEYLLDWTTFTQTFAHVHLVGCASISTSSSKTAGRWEALVTVKSQGSTSINWHLRFDVAAYNADLGRPVDFVSLRFRQSGMTDLPGSYELYYVYPSGAQLVQAPWWLVLASKALGKIFLFVYLLLLSGPAGIMAAVAVWPADKVIQAGNGSVTFAISDGQFEVSWHRGLFEPAPPQVIIILDWLFGNNVKLELEEVKTETYVPGGVATCLYQPTTPTGGKLPSIDEGNIVERYAWWAFGGLADGLMFVVR